MLINTQYRMDMDVIKTVPSTFFGCTKMFNQILKRKRQSIHKHTVQFFLLPSHQIVSMVCSYCARARQKNVVRAKHGMLKWKYESPPATKHMEQRTNKSASIRQRSDVWCGGFKRLTIAAPVPSWCFGCCVSCGICCYGFGSPVPFARFASNAITQLASVHSYIAYVSLGRCHGACWKVQRPQSALAL